MLHLNALDGLSASEVLRHLKRLHSHPNLPGIDYVSLYFHELDMWPEYKPPPVKVSPRRECLRPLPLDDYIRMPLNLELITIRVSADNTWGLIDYVPEHEDLEADSKVKLPSEILLVGSWDTDLGDKENGVVVSGVF